jgi:hypothetical protein
LEQEEQVGARINLRLIIGCNAGIVHGVSAPRSEICRLCLKKL